MEIKVSDIPDQGLSVKFTMKPDEFGDTGEDLGVPGPVSARMSVTKLGQQVELSGEVSGVVELLCSRCARRYKLDFTSGLDLHMVPLGSTAREEERELQPGELDVEFYSGDVIDLSAVVVEQTLLQAPMKPLCREDCKGLCQYCGQDLNDGECGCEPPTGHPGLSALKSLLDKEGGKE